MNIFNINLKKPLHHLMIGLFCFLLSFDSFSQNEIELKKVEEELIIQLNQFREKSALTPLKRSEVLDAVAFDQAEYVAEKGRIVHEQEKEQKKTLSDRILYFEALNSEAGENIAMISPNSKTQIEKGGENIVLQSEILMVQAAIYSWQEAEDSKLNLTDPNFYEIGIGVHESERKEIVMVVVLASLPYEIPEGVKQKFNFRGLESYSNEKCKTYEDKFNTSPELFSDAFSIEGEEMYFSYHNQALIESLLENSSDAISAEIVCDWQFKCEEGNRLFPGDITNGYLMPLLRKGAISNLNLAEKEGELKLSIGDVPAVFIDEGCEINGMVIKDNAKCASIPFNRIDVVNLRWLDLPLQQVKVANDSSLSWKDSLDMKFYAKHISVLDSEINENSALIHQLGFEIDNIDIEVSLSPTVNPRIFDGFEYELLKALKLDSSKLTANNFRKKVNWDAYEAFAQNTFYDLETKEMNEEEKIEYLNTTRMNDPKLDYFLDSLSYMEIGIYGEVNLDQDLSFQQQKDLFQFALKQKKDELALYMFNQILENKDASKEELNKISSTIRQTRTELSLLNNLIVHLAEQGELIYDGNPLTTAFLELHLVDASNSMIRFNYLISKMKDWAEHKTKISSIKEWQSSMNKLRSAVDADLFARVMLNFQMLMADHYYDLGDASLREKAFKNVMSWIPKANLNDDMLYSIAQYLAYQDQSYNAIQTLLPIVKAENTPAKHLFYFLQLAIYDEEEISEKFYYQSLQKAAELYPKEFCQFFSKDKMGKQVLQDYEIKALYCENCKN